MPLCQIICSHHDIKTQFDGRNYTARIKTAYPRRGLRDPLPDADNSFLRKVELDIKKSIYSALVIFPTPNIERTSDYYVNVMGFRAVKYLDVKEPHICLYRDDTEIVLTKARTDKVYPNRELYGYGEDAYFITAEQETLLDEFMQNGAKIVRELQLTDYNNREFIVEDIDGRWIVFGIKIK